jgi:hypothetical protein
MIHRRPLTLISAAFLCAAGAGAGPGMAQGQTGAQDIRALIAEQQAFARSFARGLAENGRWVVQWRNEAVVRAGGQALGAISAADQAHFAAQRAAAGQSRFVAFADAAENGLRQALDAALATFVAPIAVQGFQGTSQQFLDGVVTAQKNQEMRRVLDLLDRIAARLAAAGQQARIPDRPAPVGPPAPPAPVPIAPAVPAPAAPGSTAAPAAAPVPIAPAAAGDPVTILGQVAGAGTPAPPTGTPAAPSTTPAAGPAAAPLPVPIPPPTAAGPTGVPQGPVATPSWTGPGGAPVVTVELQLDPRTLQALIQVVYWLLARMQAQAAGVGYPGPVPGQWPYAGAVPAQVPVPGQYTVPAAAGFVTAPAPAPAPTGSPGGDFSFVPLAPNSSAPPANLTFAPGSVPAGLDPAGMPRDLGINGTGGLLDQATRASGLRSPGSR